MAALSDYRTVQELLRRHGFAFTKSLGQNFLVDPSVCPRMAELAAECGAQGVVEIGPGVGVLTQELSSRFAKVVAFEVDRALEPVLAQTLSPCGNVQVRFEDILQADLRQVIERDFAGMQVCVCANLPYYITSPILMHLLEGRFPFRSITVMIQKEAAQRICAQPGSRLSGALTAAVHYYAEPEMLFDVSRGSFMPAPNVDSTVIRLTVREAPPVQVSDTAHFFRLIRAAFAQRRKTAANSISAGLGIPKADVIAALSDCGFSETVRAETFSLADFALLSDRLYKGVTI